MSFKKTLQNLRIKIGKALLDKTIVRDIPITPKRFLFLRQDGKIGDIIVSSFVFKALKSYFPDCEISVVCSDANRELLHKFQEIDKIYTLPKRSIKARFHLGKVLRKEKFDYLLDPTVFLRNRDLFFIRLIGAKNNIGFLKADYKIFNLNIENSSQHFATVYEQMLKYFIKNNFDTHYIIPQNKETEKNVVNFLHNNQLEHYIALNLFGAGSNRQFSEEKAIDLINYVIHSSTKNIVLLGYPSVMDKLKNYRQKCVEPERIYLYEPTKTIFDNISLIKYADLCISPDTSIVHIAVGLDRPLISFYSEDEENFQHWHPNIKNTSYILRYKNHVNNIDIKDIKPNWFN